MAINTDKLKQAQLPNLNRPQTNREAYHQQNTDAISGAIALRTQEISSSLQRLDRQLADFEERFALAAVNRVEQVGIRIEQRMAAILRERAVARSGFNVEQAIDGMDVPSFELPPAITPVMGALQG